MRITVIGASGPTGRLVVSGALERGHTVTAAARSLDSVEPADRLTLRRTDVRDVASVRDAVRGQDAVVSAVGTSARSPGGLYRAAGESLVAAMRAEGVRRLIVVSSGGVRADDPGLPLWYRLAIPIFLRDLYADMGAMEDLIRASDLDWTLVRAAYLTNGVATGRYRVQDGANPRGGWRISRADLADLLVDQAVEDRWVRRAPTVAY